MKHILLPIALLGLLIFTISPTNGQTFSEAELDSIWELSLDQVVVTGQYAPTDIRSAVQPIRVIKAEEVLQRGATNLNDVLQQELFLRIAQDQVLGSSQSLLGLSGRNVKILLDGVPVIGRLAGNIDLNQLQLQQIDRIEIVEGPMAVNYGTDALAGVINIVTKKSQLPDLEVQLSTQQEGRGEDNIQASLGIRPGEKWLFQWSGGMDQFEGFTQDDTLRSDVWNPKEQVYFNTGLRYDITDDHYIRVGFNFFDEQVDDLGFVRRPEFKPYVLDNFYETQRWTAMLQQQGRIGQHWHLNSTLSYANFDRYVSYYRTDLDNDSTYLTGSGVDTTYFDAAQLLSIVAYEGDNQRWNAQFGLDLRYDEGAGERILDSLSNNPGSAVQYEAAAFTKVQFRPLDPLLIEGGLRAAYNSRFSVPLIPSIFVKYDLSPTWSARASYAKGFRSPDLKELFINFIDINHYIVGNQSLLPEEGNHVQLRLEGDYRQGKHAIDGQLMGFYNQISQRISLFEYVELEEGVYTPAVDTATGRYAYFNQADFQNHGLSGRLRYRHQHVELRLGYALTGFYQPIAENKEYNLNLFTYTNEWNAALRFTLPGINTNLNLWLRSQDRLISFYLGQVDGETQTLQREQDGFAVIDASIQQNFWKDRIRLTAGVRNLADVQQAALTGGSAGVHSSGNAIPISPGRSFFIQLSTTFTANWR
ncbi:MAG: TonB-dependent receptor [Bacteroidota bacterium]